MKNIDFSAFPMEGNSLGEKIANELRYKIISGEIGYGEVLSENNLASHFGTSRSPVREALKVLASEGLISLERSGILVKGLENQDIHELYDVRLLIEGFALERLVLNMDDKKRESLFITIDKMELAAKYNNPIEFSKHDLDFHTLIIQYSNHKRIFHLWNNIRFIIFTILLIATEKRFDRNKAEIPELISHHRNILIALDEGDVNKVKKVIHEHYKDAFTTIYRSVINE